jgi:hypothetical protein
MSARPPGDDDDSVEMTVNPAPIEPETPPQPLRRQPRRRTPNPTADEVIHSGEIAPRSMIVRSGESNPSIHVEPKVEIREDKTEQMDVPPIPEEPPPAIRRPALWLGAAAVPALAAVALLLADRTGAGSAQQGAAPDTTTQRVGLEAAAQFIGTTLDAQAHAAATRAEAMASSSMLRAGIETDAQTMADMAHDKDVAFPIKPNETLEVYQIHDGTPTSMLRLPDGAPSRASPGAGKTRIDSQAGGLVIVAAGAIESTRPGLSGVLVLAVPVDLEAMKKRVAEHTQSASLVGLGPAIPLATGNAAGTKVTLPVETESKAQVQLEAVMPEAPQTTVAGAPRGGGALRIVRYACLGLTGVLLIGFVATARKRA